MSLIMRLWRRIRREPPRPPDITLTEELRTRRVVSNAERTRQRLRRELQVFDERMERLWRQIEEGPPS